MSLERKQDFEKTLARFEAWWHAQLVDRPVVTIHVRPEKQIVKPPEKEHATVRDRWLDAEHVLACVEAGVANGAFFADSFPHFHPNLGPDLCAVLYGGDLEFHEGTSWSKPILKDVRDLLKLEPDFGNTYWQWMRDLTDQAAERGRGKWITGVTDLHMDGDLLSALRGPKELCMDCIDDAEGVALACQHVTASWGAIYDDLYSRACKHNPISTSWTPTLHKGKSYNIQCDFICFLSPKQFQDLVLPSLVTEMRHVERSIFHLDGPDALRHLDALLATPELHAIQWVYGAGRGPAAKWTDVYKRIQAAGKAVQIICENADDARQVAENLRPQGVWLAVGGSYTRAEAEDVLKWVEAWTAKDG
jgi:hypothetical protein